MTCNITSTPLYVEPLPLYQRENPDDSISIRSAAPSYVSETPSYTSQCRNHHTSHGSTVAPSASARTNASNPPGRVGLPARQYAPGFHAHPPLVPSVDSIAYNNNMGNWSSTRSSHASRQYHAVARRRASRATSPTAVLNSLSAIPQVSPTSSQSNLASASASSHSYPVDVATGPVNPLEDPYLVGEEAARKARAQRIYREMCLKGEETARYESRTWEFMFSQMTDWEERERSWSRFRDQVGNTKLLGRRLGLRT